MDKGRFSIGLGFLVVTIAYGYGAAQMALGTAGRPGPGVWPLAIAGMSGLVAIATTLEALKLQPGEVTDTEKMTPGETRQDRRRFWGYIVGLLVYVVLIPFVGMVVSTLAFLTGLIVYLGATSWVRAIVISVISTAILWYVFQNFFLVRLPTGFLI